MTNIENIPKHIAIIMDGNGRWAKNHGLPRFAGHKKGIDNIENIIKAAKDLGVKVITLFAFSTENWLRPKSEVNLLMNSLDNFLKNRLSDLNKNNISLRVSGRNHPVPEKVLISLKNAEIKTKNNDGIILNLAFNYGSRQEIVDAVKKIVQDAKDNKLNINDFDENKFSEYLYTKGLPDPDLLIRTSGEQRISNFLLWQLSYAEFYFTDKYWPDFSKEDLKKAILVYQNRERRYGNIKQ